MFKYVKKRVDGLFKKKIIRSVGILVGGTAFSQLIMLSALPFITRLYSPDDFSVLATYISLLALLTVIACLRFEIAIPIAKEENASFHLFILSLISVIGITTLVVVLLFVFSEEVNEATNNRLNGYLWLIPIGVFFSGTYSALQYWMTREQKFFLVAKTRMTQSISAVTTQLVCGFAGISPLGLLLGHLLSVGAGVFSLLRFFLKEYRTLFKYFSLQKLKKTFKQFDRFPKYSTWEALTNSAGIQIPILIIAALAIGPEAGFLMLAMRLLSAPMMLIGASVGQVYLAEGARKYHEGELESFTNKTILILAKLSIIPLLIAGVIAPIVVPIIFGDEWHRTGVLISWMAPWFFMQFITSPVSMSLHITGSQKTALLLQMIGLVIRGGSVFFAAAYINDWVGEVYAVSGFVFYFIYLIIILINLKFKNKVVFVESDS